MPRLARHYSEYQFLFWLTQLIGVLAFVILCVWVLNFRDGLSWSLMDFDWHILCLPLGLIHLCAIQSAIFRTLHGRAHRQVKLLHAALSVPVVVLLVIGSWAVVGPRLAKSRNHLFSLHSWLGVLTALLYIAQGAVGCGMFLWPKAGLESRASYKPLHVFLGLTTFVMSTASTLLGMFEMMRKIDGYSNFSGEGMMMNFCGTLYTVYTVLVIFTTTWTDYQNNLR